MCDFPYPLSTGSRSINNSLRPSDLFSEGATPAQSIDRSLDCSIARKKIFRLSAGALGTSVPFCSPVLKAKLCHKYNEYIFGRAWRRGARTMEPLRFRSLLAGNWRTLQPECWFLCDRKQLLMEHRRRRLLMNECDAVGQWITQWSWMGPLSVESAETPKIRGNQGKCRQTLTPERFALRCRIKHKVRVNADTLWQLFDNNGRRTTTKDMENYGKVVAWLAHTIIDKVSRLFPPVSVKRATSRSANIQNANATKVNKHRYLGSDWETEPIQAYPANPVQSHTIISLR